MSRKIVSLFGAFGKGGIRFVIVGDCLLGPDGILGPNNDIPAFEVACTSDRDNEIMQKFYRKFSVPDHGVHHKKAYWHISKDNINKDIVDTIKPGDIITGNFIDAKRLERHEPFVGYEF